MTVYLDILLLLLIIAIIELSDLTLVSLILSVQGLLFLYEFGMLKVETLPLFVFSVVISPFLIYYLTKRTKKDEEEPLISGFLSVSLLLILVVAGYVLSNIFNLSNLSLPLAFAGVYGLIAKTDLRKTAASLSILACVAHLFTTSLGFEIDLVLIFLFSILLLILLYMADKLFAAKRSLSTRDLKELRF